MAQEETYGTRDRSYSVWHRRMSTQRFVGIEVAQTLAMIDLDGALFVEYDDGTKEPLALIETAMDVGQSFKSATVTRNLARRCNPTLPAYVLLYKLSDDANPCAPEFKDICQFRYRRLWPEPVSTWKIVSPGDWALKLVSLRNWSAQRVNAMIDAAAVAS
jgi:hypothetical protein